MPFLLLTLSLILKHFSRHLGLYHTKLDMLLQDSLLLEEKRSKTSALTRPMKREPINLCPICDFKDPSREHVSRFEFKMFMGVCQHAGISKH